MKKLLIIALNWPAPNYSAAGVRLMQLVDFFKRQGYRTTIASTADKSAITSSNFEDIGLESILLNDASFDRFVKDLDPDIVLFDRFMAEEQFGWRVIENVPNALRILDSEDLHSLRKSREKALKKNLFWNKDLWLQHDMTKREVASILRCDLSLIISSFEMALLETVVPNHKSLLLHLPFMINRPTKEEIDQWPTFEERKDFIFVGFGGHMPNVDAIEYLKKEIWPLIRKQLPEVKLNVYGGNLPEKIYRLHNDDEGFLIQGWAEDVQEVISKARIMLAPLRFGAGQKGKLLNAMLYGTPSVTTIIGAEGMSNNLDWNGQICNEPNAISQAAIEDYQNKSAWTNYQKNGRQLIEEIFEKSALEKQLKEKLGHLQEHIPAHRNSNFIGNLLSHQTLASTKFMSKWIEEKNKK